MSVFQTGKMIYRNFGNSGLKTSVIALGNMINSKEENYAIDEEIVRVALANGINHFDTAQAYDAGKAEIQLGKILKNLKVEREDIIIATKIRTAPEPDINSDDIISRKHIKESIDGSLKRLQLDYVDVLYAHFYEDQTPLEEICRGFHEIIEDGKAFYWATSNWDAESVFNALAICERLNLHKPIGSESQYNMLVRTECQVEFINLYQKYKYGLIGWSPLAGGFLTGKYLNGISEQEIHRFNDKNSPFPLKLMKEVFYDAHAGEKNNSVIKQLSELADKEFGATLAQLALAWAIKYQYTSSVLTGARNVAQLLDCLKSIDLVEKWTPETEKRINKLLGTTPTPRMDFRAWKPSASIRPVAQ